MAQFDVSKVSKFYLWRDELILNFMVLTKFGELNYFLISFPFIIINNINQIFVNLQQDIHQDNVVPCVENRLDCIINWTKILKSNPEYYNTSITDDPHPLNNLIHCERCHNINQGFMKTCFEKDKSFECVECGQICCSRCFSEKTSTSIQSSRILHLFFCLDCK